MKIIVILVSLFFVGCGKAEKGNISLQPDEPIEITGIEGHSIFAEKLGSSISIGVLSADGSVPITMEISEDTISVTSRSIEKNIETVVFDGNGDGLPEQKMTLGQRKRLFNLIFEERAIQ